VRSYGGFLFGVAVAVKRMDHTARAWREQFDDEVAFTLLRGVCWR
jgi:hypothetical protein